MGELGHPYDCRESDRFGFGNSMQVHPRFCPHHLMLQPVGNSPKALLLCPHELPSHQQEEREELSFFPYPSIPSHILFLVPYQGISMTPVVRTVADKRDEQSERQASNSGPFWESCTAPHGHRWVRPFHRHQFSSFPNSDAMPT